MFIFYWDRKCLAKLDELGIKVKGYKRFKDDTNIMLTPVDRKLKFNAGQLILKNEEEMSQENKLDNDEVTMTVINDVADSIEDMVKTEVDFPTNVKNKQSKMPILDIHVWIRRIESENKVKKQLC